MIERWQIEVDRDDISAAVRLIQKFNLAGFDVWVWKNTNRITVSGDRDKLLIFSIKNNFSHKSRPWPNPDNNPLAEYIPVTDTGSIINKLIQLGYRDSILTSQQRTTRLTRNGFTGIV